MDTDTYKRLATEATELQLKIYLLQRFLHSDNLENVSTAQVDLLQAQLKAMIKYSDILILRLKT